MEDLTGITINPDIYDDLYTRERRQRVRRLADLLGDMEHLRKFDRREASDGTLLSRRGHRYAVAQMIDATIRYVFHCTPDQLPDVFQDMTKADIEDRMTGFAELFGEQLVRLLGWRPGHQTHEPLDVLRWILSKIGAIVRYRQIMREGERFYLYSFDCKCWEKMLTYAAGHLKQRQLRQQEPLLKSGNYSHYPNLSNDAKSPKSKPEKGKNKESPSFEGLLL